MKKTKNSFVFSQTNFIYSLLFVCSFLVLSSCSSNTENANSSGGGSVTIKPTNIVHEGSVVLKNQLELNAFAQKGYTSVNGALTIGEFPKCDITSLEGLKSLTKINGCLIVIGTIDLNSLEGLNNITSTECISIIDAKKLTNIDPLKNLKSIIDNDLTNGVWMSEIAGNDNLIDIDGLSGIENYVGALQIFNNKVLLNLDGLKNINSFNPFGVTIKQNESLTNLNGLSAVNSIGNVLEISDNENLKSLDGLNNLNSVKSFCHITGNSKLKNLCAIKGLANNGENFTLDIRNNGYNPTRQNLIDGNCIKPTNIVHEGTVVLKNQQELNIFAQKGYTSINGTLKIGDDASKSDITSLEGLKSLTKINGSLFIIGTPDLNSLEGLNNITSTECISIIGAKKLTNIDPLKNIKSVVDNDLTNGVWVTLISGNDNLIDIDGLSGIENYVGALQIFNNKALLNLDGLKNINSFNTFSVAIRQNESLNNLNGLSAVNSIDNVLEISDNENLKSLDGLNNLNSVKRFCHITGNSKLKNLCAIKGLANNGENFTLDIRNNGYNPTRQDLINGNCLQ